MRRILEATTVAMVLALAVPTAAAEGPCGSVAFDSGRIQLGQAIPVTAELSPATEACLEVLARQIISRRDIVSVTVAARVDDAARASGDALRSAKAIGARLIAHGVPKRRVSSVAPRMGMEESAGIHIAYTSRTRVRPVARVVQAFGAVDAGAAPDAMKPAIVGTKLNNLDYIRTGAKGVAVLRLEDRSKVRVGPGSLLRVGPIVFEASGVRKVTLELVHGEAETQASRGGEGSRFDIRTRNAVAGVRGTRFRVTNRDADQPTRLETLGGMVDLGSDKGKVAVAGGKGSLAKPGKAPEPPRDLLPAPKVKAPLFGSVRSDAELTWKPIRGAAHYMVEFARDADFTESFVAAKAAGTRLAISTAPDTGKWFWRVKGVDPDGFIGYGSSVHALTLEP